jgi:uncharacterized protein (DUF169 family)
MVKGAAMSYASASSILTQSLNLDPPPIALALVDDKTAQGVPAATAAPSACSFWRNAERGVFYARAEAHFNCPVGALVMGFDLPKAVSDELMGLVGTMSKCGYVSPDEPGHIPTTQKKAQGIIYGPLSQFPLEPYAVLCWLSPFQAMIWNEAAGGAIWKNEMTGYVFGRPACAALPNSVRSGQPVMSLGCMGMRTFTEIAADRLLGVIPGSKLTEFVAALQSMKATNDGMRSFYVSRKEAFAQNA